MNNSSTLKDFQTLNIKSLQIVGVYTEHKALRESFEHQEHWKYIEHVQILLFENMEFKE